MNSDTHIALSDISFFAHVQNLVYLAPSSKEEYLAMLKYATTQKEHPVAIRNSFRMFTTGKEDKQDYSLTNKSEVVKQGSKVALIAVGCLVPLALEVAKECSDITVINPKFLSGLDVELLESLKSNHTNVITIEDSILEGGFGQMVASFYGNSDMKVINLGLSKKFHSDYDPDALLDEHGISKDKLVSLIKSL